MTIRFRDFYQEQYWLGHSLDELVYIVIDGVNVSQTRVGQLSNDQQAVILRVDLEEPMT